MIIKHIKIENFRSIKDVAIDFDELISILGRNGCGKSTILRAIEVFYDTSYQASDYDYFAKDSNAEIKITVTYSDLRDDELKEFASYLTGASLVVTKIINKGSSPKYYGTALQIPEFSEFRTLPAVPKRQALSQLIDEGKYPDLGPKPTNDASSNLLMDQYELAHLDLCVPITKETQFFGSKNVGGGKLDNYTKFILIPAVRDASAEVGKRGVIQQLIEVLVERSINAREDVMQLNAEFESKVKEIYTKDNIAELDMLAQDITNLLKQYAPGSALELDFDQMLTPKITLPNILASLIEDNFSSPVSYTGNGLQRALIFALLQRVSQMDISPSAVVEDAENVEEVPPLKPPDLILAIEEPELYLHPSRSRYLSVLLGRLSKKSENPGDVRTQVIFATHSPYFVSLSRFDQIRKAKKVSTPDYDVLQCEVTAFSSGEAITALAQLHEKPETDFSLESLNAHLTPVMTSIMNEGFFADLVVVVEGIGDIGILWALQEIMEMKWDAQGITIVSAQGKNSIDRPVLIFRGFGIPTYFIFDGDAQHVGTGDENSTAKKNKIYMKLANHEPEGYPATKVEKHWAVFHKDIESEIKLALGDNFEKISTEISKDLGFKPSKLFKNPEAGAAFIQKAYSLGHTIPVLEDVINKITVMSTASK